MIQEETGKIMSIKTEEKKERNSRSHICRSLKKALLIEMTEKPFEKIGVVKICKTAEVSRSAFYLHYKNVEEVLDELVDELARARPDAVFKYLLPYGEPYKSKTDREMIRGNVMDSVDYSIILKDSIASKKMVDTISEVYLDEYIKVLSEKYGLDPREGKVFFYYQIGGFITALKMVEDGLFKHIKQIGDDLDSINRKLSEKKQKK